MRNGGTAIGYILDGFSKTVNMCIDTALPSKLYLEMMLGKAIKYTGCAADSHHPKHGEFRMKKIKVLMLCTASIPVAISLLGCPPPAVEFDSVLVKGFTIMNIPLEADTTLPGGATPESIAFIVGPLFNGDQTIAVFNPDSPAAYPGWGIPEIDGNGIISKAPLFKDGFTFVAQQMNPNRGQPQRPLPAKVSSMYPDTGIIQIQYATIADQANTVPTLKTLTWRTSLRNKAVDGILTLDWNDAMGAGSGEIIDNWGEGSTLNEKFRTLKDEAAKDSTYTVYVEGNETLDPKNGDLSWTDNRKITIVLTAKSPSTVTLSSGTTGSLFSVGANITLKLSGPITLQGIPNNSAALVNVARDGKLIMENGVKITKNISGSGGGGVNNAGIFTMSGGEISYNNVKGNTYGGGVYNTGNFTMIGGNISENTAGRHGGGVYSLGATATFKFVDGEISDNKADGRNGGGVFVQSGTFAMSGGAISRNNAIGNDGPAYGNGGGVYIANGDTFTMTGGTIYGSNAGNNANTATGSGAALFDGTGISEDDTITNYQGNP